MLYDSWWDTAADVDMGGTEDTAKDHTVKLWLTSPRGDILEIGCGRGRLLTQLATDFPHNDYTGYDPSLVLLSQAPKLDNVTYVNELPDKKFVFIYSMLVFQHIGDNQKREYILWAAKHLEPKGAFRFQYVNEGDFAPRNFPIRDSRIALYCLEAGLVPEFTADDKYPQWTWCTARLQ